MCMPCVFVCEYNLRMAEEVMEKLESKGYEIYTEESIESLRTTSRLGENIMEEKMRKLRLADLKKTLWQRRGYKNELEKFMEETERKNREKRWEIREEMWRNEAGLPGKKSKENIWRKGMERLVEVKEERKRAEEEKKSLKTKYLERENDDEDWEKWETYVGKIEKC